MTQLNYLRIKIVLIIKGLRFEITKTLYYIFTTKQTRKLVLILILILFNQVMLALA